MTLSIIYTSPLSKKDWVQKISAKILKNVFRKSFLRISFLKPTLESEKYLKAEYEKLETETLLIRAEELRKPFEGFPYCNIKAGRPLRYDRTRLTVGTLRTRPLNSRPKMKAVKTELIFQ